MAEAAPGEDAKRSGAITDHLDGAAEQGQAAATREMAAQAAGPMRLAARALRCKNVADAEVRAFLKSRELEIVGQRRTTTLRATEKQIAGTAPARPATEREPLQKKNLLPLSPVHKCPDGLQRRAAPVQAPLYTLTEATCQTTVATQWPPAAFLRCDAKSDTKWNRRPFLSFRVLECPSFAISPHSPISRYMMISGGRPSFPIVFAAPLCFFTVCSSSSASGFSCETPLRGASVAAAAEASKPPPSANTKSFTASIKPRCLRRCWNTLLVSWTSRLETAAGDVSGFAKEEATLGPGDVKRVALRVTAAKPASHAKNGKRDKDGTHTYTLVGFANDAAEKRMCAAATTCAQASARGPSLRVWRSPLCPCSCTPVMAHPLRLRSHFSSDVHSGILSFSIGHGSPFFYSLSTSFCTHPVAVSLARRWCSSSAPGFTLDTNNDSVAGAAPDSAPVTLSTSKWQASGFSFISCQPSSPFKESSRFSTSISWSPAAFRACSRQLQQQGQLLQMFLQLPYVSWRSLLRLLLTLLQHPIGLYLREPLFLAPVCRRVNLKHFCCIDPLVGAAALLPDLGAHAAPGAGSMKLQRNLRETAVNSVAMETANERDKRHKDRYGMGAESVDAPMTVYTSLPVVHARDMISPCRKEGDTSFSSHTANTAATAADSLYAAASPLKEFLMQLDDWHVRGHPFHTHAVQRLFLAVALRKERYTMQQLLVLIHVLAPLQMLPGLSGLLLQRPVSHWQQQAHALQEKEEQRRSSKKIPPVETLEEQEMTVQLLLDHLLAHLRRLPRVDNITLPPMQQRRSRSLQQHTQAQQQQQQPTDTQQHGAKTQQMELGQQQLQLQHPEKEKQHHHVIIAGAHEVEKPSFLWRHSNISAAAAAVGQHQQQQSIFLPDIFTLQLLVEAYEIVSRAALSTVASAAAASCRRLFCSFSKMDVNPNGGGAKILHNSEMLPKSATETSATSGKHSVASPLLSLLSSREGSEDAAAKPSRKTEVEMQLAALCASSPTHHPFEDSVFSEKAPESTAEKHSVEDPNNAATMNTAAATAEVLTWLSRTILRCICAKQRETGGLPLALADPAAPTGKPSSKHIVATVAFAPSTKVHQQQQQQPQEQQMVLLLAGASQTLIYHAFLSGLMQRQESLSNAAGTAGDSEVAAAVESDPLIATAAIAEQTLQLSGEKGEANELPSFSMAKFVQTQKAAAAAALALLSLCSKIAADAATGKQQQRYKREKQQQTAGDAPQNKQLIHRIANADASAAADLGGKEEKDLDSAGPAAVKDGKEGQQQMDAADKSAVISALLRVCALQVPEPFFAHVAQKLWLAFRKNFSRLKIGSRSSKRWSKRARAAMDESSSSSSSREACAIDAAKNSSPSRSSSSISSDKGNNSNWSQSVLSKVSSSFTSSWWNAATNTTTEEAAAAAAPTSLSEAVPTHAKQPDASSLLLSSPQKELSMLLHFLPLLCRCAAAAAFRPPNAAAAAISPHTATCRRRFWFQQRQQQQQQQEGVCGLSTTSLTLTGRSAGRKWSCFSSSIEALDDGGDAKKLLQQLGVGRIIISLAGADFTIAIKRVLLCLERVLVLQQQQQQLYDQASEQQPNRTKAMSPQLLSQQHNGNVKHVFNPPCTVSEADIHARHVKAAVLVYATAGAAHRLLLMQQQAQRHTYTKQQRRYPSPRQFRTVIGSANSTAGTPLQWRLQTLSTLSGNKHAKGVTARALCQAGLPGGSTRWRCGTLHADKKGHLQHYLQQSELLHMTAQVQMQNAVARTESLSCSIMKRILDEFLFSSAAAAVASPYNSPFSSSSADGPATVSPLQSPTVAPPDARVAAEASTARNAATMFFSSPSAVGASVSAVPLAAVVAARYANAASLQQWLIHYIIATCPLSQVADSFALLSKAAAAAAVHAYVASRFRLPATRRRREEGGGDGGEGGAAYGAPIAVEAQERRKKEYWRSQEAVAQQEQQHALAEKQQKDQQQQDAQYMWKRLWGTVRDLGQHLKRQLHEIRREYQQQCRISEKKQKLFLSTLPQFQQHSREFLLREEDLNLQPFAMLLNSRTSVCELSSSKQVRHVIQCTTRDTNRAAATLQSLCCSTSRLLPLLPRTSVTYTGQEAGPTPEEMQHQGKRKALEADSKAREIAKEELVCEKNAAERSALDTCGKTNRMENDEREEEVEPSLDKEGKSARDRRGDDKEGKAEEETNEREKYFVSQLQQVQQVVESVARAARHCLYTAVLQEPLQRKRWRGPCQGEVEWAEHQAIAVAAVRDKKKREELREHWNQKEKLEKKRKQNEEEKDHEKRKKEKIERAEKDKKKKEKQEERKDEEEADEAARKDKEERSDGSSPQKNQEKKNQLFSEETLQKELWDLVHKMQPVTGNAAWDLSRPPRACRANPRLYVHHIRLLQNRRDNFKRPERNRLAHT